MRAVLVSLLWTTILVAAPLGREAKLRVAGGRLVNAAGETVTFYGVNLFQSHLMWSRHQNLEEADAALTAIAALGFNAVRMPLNLAWFEPAPGVFPDSPEYEGILKDHGLPTGAVAFYDGIVDRAAELGLYVIPELHELPVDPYRWFVGGEERDRGSDKPGHAIAWMGVADPERKGRYHLDSDLAREHVPQVLGWMAGHWRGVANVAGIEAPWNEPGGPLTQGPAYFDLCRACAVAVKTADPERLVFIDCVDWGAMVNRLADESVWKLPDEVDALFPHFYPGAHSTNSGPEGTWSTSMANWASWLMGSGKPVMVGEYGVVMMGNAGYWKNGVTDEQRATTYAACAAQWYAMGVQGLFGWAWDGGIGRDKETGELNQGAEVLPRWAAPMEQTVPGPPQLAVVCSPKHRSSYGDKRDLWRVTDALLDAHLTPFATIFEAQVLAQPDVLDRFRAVLVLESDLGDEAKTAVRQSGKQAFWLPPDLTGLDDAVKQLAAPDALPANVIVGYADGQATIFERKGQAGEVRLRLAIPGAAGRGKLVGPDGQVLFEGEAERLAREGANVVLAPWDCLVVRWQ